MTGWGQDGPLAHTAGHDIDYIALSGALGACARHGERPLPPVNMIGDFGGGGAFLALGIVAAMWEAQHSGKGQVVDAAMVDGSAVLTTMMHGLIAQGRWRDEAGVNFADTGSPYYEVYECADGRYVGVGRDRRPVLRRAAALVSASTRDELPDRRDEASWPALKERFADVFRTRTRDEWAARFAGTDACVAPVLTLTEAPQHPHNVRPAARSSSTAASSNRHRLPASAARRPPSAAPRRHPATHSREILVELGYRPDDVERLHAVGAVITSERQPMKVDATLTKDVDRTKEAAAELEAAGYDGLWVGETKHDPFLAVAAGGRRHRADHDRHGHRHRLRPHAR